MAGRIPQGFIDELLSRVDVVDVVDSRVKLKKAGKNYSACCPFHSENTPSFTVSRDKQFYYCFGCGATGSALKFVMEYDGLAFPDAVEKLADTAGLSVPRESNPAAEREQQEHKPLYELLNQSADFYAQMLRKHHRKEKAIQYLKGRGLSGQAARFFNIGYAPEGWDNLQSSLATDQHTTRHLIANGMLIERDDGRTYDRFRDRIMFPIRDIKGRTIAFGGRVLGDEKPKYLNSPETPVFQKNRELYGLYEARKIRQKLTRLLIVEGYMDVVALAEHGVHYAVATLGTATSEHHLRRLFRMVPEILFCFDGDNAGRTAAARAMETVLPVLEDGRQARFLFLPDGEDPDSLIRAEGKTAFEQRLATASHLPEFLFDHLKEQVDFDSLDGKARLDQLAAPLISRIPNGTLKDLMVAELERQIGIASRAMSKIEASTVTEPEASSYLSPPHHDAPPPEFDDQAAASVTETPQDTDTSVDDLAPRIHRALSALIRAPQLAQNLTMEPLPEPHSEYERLFIEVIKKLKEGPQHTRVGVLIQWIGSPYHQTLTDLANQADSGVTPVVADIQTALRHMEARQYQAEYQQLQAMNADARQRKSMTSKQRQRFRELQLKRRSIHGSRAQIYLNKNKAY